MTQSWTVLEERLAAKLGERRLPLSGAFELTARCNLSCRMCYVCEGMDLPAVIRQEKPMEWWLALARQARDAGMLHLQLTGGEVTLLPWFSSFYREVAQMGLFLTVNTNATRIDESLADLFAAYPPLEVSVSLYGLSRETARHVTGNPLAGELALAGLDRLHRRGLPFVVKMPVLRSLLPELEQAAEVVRARYGKALDVVDYIHPRRDGATTDNVGERLAPEELFRFQMERMNLFRPEGEELFTVQSVDADAPDDAAAAGPFPCHAGDRSFFLSWNGRMLPCALMDHPAVPVGPDGFLPAWSALAPCVRSVPVCEDCLACSHRDVCMVCPARLQRETGANDQAAPYLCRLAALTAGKIGGYLKNEDVCY